MTNKLSARELIGKMFHEKSGHLFFGCDLMGYIERYIQMENNPSNNDPFLVNESQILEIKYTRETLETFALTNMDSKKLGGESIFGYLKLRNEFPATEKCFLDEIKNKELKKTLKKNMNRFTPKGWSQRMDELYEGVIRLYETHEERLDGKVLENGKQI